eukprot:TRINITY_DN11330_c0_g2_i1.p1 TRINITY_DN11330_c0_g2~~TRINITY_DN11330_c0_g2_i1.p1  ORF type:complete len:774 (+),score=76.52 TRINITY_DN11330_c0_g2_i1:168-2489(+)
MSWGIKGDGGGVDVVLCLATPTKTDVASGDLREALRWDVGAVLRHAVELIDVVSLQRRGDNRSMRAEVTVHANDNEAEGELLDLVVKVQCALDGGEFVWCGRHLCTRLIGGQTVTLCSVSTFVQTPPAVPHPPPEAAATYGMKGAPDAGVLLAPDNHPSSPPLSLRGTGVQAPAARRSSTGRYSSAKTPPTAVPSAPSQTPRAKSPPSSAAPAGSTLVKSPSRGAAAYPVPHGEAAPPTEVAPQGRLGTGYVQRLPSPVRTAHAVEPPSSSRGKKSPVVTVEVGRPKQSRVRVVDGAPGARSASSPRARRARQEIDFLRAEEARLQLRPSTPPIDEIDSDTASGDADAVGFLSTYATRRRRPSQCERELVSRRRVHSPSGMGLRPDVTIGGHRVIPGGRAVLPEDTKALERVPTSGVKSPPASPFAVASASARSRTRTPTHLPAPVAHKSFPSPRSPRELAASPRAPKPTPVKFPPSGSPVAHWMPASTGAHRLLRTIPQGSTPRSHSTGKYPSAKGPAVVPARSRSYTPAEAVPTSIGHRGRSTLEPQHLLPRGAPPQTRHPQASKALAETKATMSRERTPSAVSTPGASHDRVDDSDEGHPLDARMPIPSGAGCSDDRDELACMPEDAAKGGKYGTPVSVELEREAAGAPSQSTFVGSGAAREDAQGCLHDYLSKKYSGPMGGGNHPATLHAPSHLSVLSLGAARRTNSYSGAPLPVAARRVPSSPLGSRDGYRALPAAPPASAAGRSAYSGLLPRDGPLLDGDVFHQRRD